MAAKMPDNVAGLDYTKTAVPAEGRMPAFGLTMAWWSCCSAMFYLIIAATLAETYGTLNTIIGMVLSVISYAAINAPITRYALRTGLSVSLFSRLLFGRTGSIIATLIFAVTTIYYTVFEGSVIAIAATFLYDWLDYKVAALIVVLYSVPLVFGSVQHWLDKFNGVLLPFYLLGLAGTVALAIYDYGYSNAWLTAAPAGGAPDYGWFNVYVAYMGVWILMLFCFDFARFAKKKDEEYHALVNFGAPFYAVALLVNGLVGIFLVNTIPVEGVLTEVSAVKAVIVMMGIYGLLFVWITQTRINTTNFYLSSVNLQSLARLVAGVDLPKHVWAIIVGVIVYFLMLANIFHYLLAALAYQGIFVVAWVGVAVAYMLGRGRYEEDGAGGKPDDAYPAYKVQGLVAWFGAVAIGIVCLNIPSLEVLSAPGTAIGSFIIYWLFEVGSRREAEATS